LIEIANLTTSPTYLSKLSEVAGTCGATIFNPISTNPQTLIMNRYKPATKVVKLNTFLNKAGNNDATGNDELKVYIFSDVLNQIFSCGTY
jgi:hypothetical protein